jgi:hypothetical protein
MATSFLVAFLTPLAISRTSTACILQTTKWSQLDHEDHPVEELGLPSPRLQQDIWSHSQVVGRHNLDRGAKWWTRLNLQPILAAIGNCTQLKILDVGHNKLSGPLPHELGKLKNLQKLFAGNHQLKAPSQRNSAAPLLARDRHQPQQNNWPDSFNLRWDFLSQFGWLRLHQQHAHRYGELWTHVYTSPIFFARFLCTILMLNRRSDKWVCLHHTASRHSYFCHCHIVLVAGPIPRAMQIQGEASFRPGNPGLCGKPLPNNCK